MAMCSRLWKCCWYGSPAADPEAPPCPACRAPSLASCGALLYAAVSHHHVTFAKPQVYAISLVAAGVLSSTTAEGVQVYSLVAAAFLVVSNVAIVVALPLIAPVHQSSAYVFGQFDSSDSLSTGIPNNV